MKPRGKQLLLGMVIAAGILNYADRQIIAVLKPIMQVDLHWTDQDYGNLTAIFQFSAAIALLFAGRLVDRIGWRRANPLAVGAWSLAAMAHAVARGGLQFGAARLALGATEAMATPTALKSLTAAYPVSERGLALGVMNAANSIGAILTPLVIPLLALRFGWRNSFLVTGGLGLIWVLAWSLLQPGALIVDDVAGGQPTSPTVRWRTVFGDRRTWAITGAKLFSDQVWWLLLFWTPDLLHRIFHLGLSEIGLPLAVIYCGAALGAVVAGYASNQVLKRGVSLNRTRKFSLLVLSLATLPLAFAPFAPNVAWATAILTLTVAAHQGYSTNIFALCTEIIPKERVATVISFSAFCGNLAGMLILQAAGRVLGAGLGYGPLLAYGSLCYLIGLALVQLLVPRLEAAEMDADPSDLSRLNAAPH